MRLDLRTTGNTPLHLEGLWDREQPGGGKWDLPICTEGLALHITCPSLHKTTLTLRTFSLHQTPPLTFHLSLLKELF